MSRLAKKPINIKEGVTITKDGPILIFKGLKGEHKFTVMPGVEITIENGSISIKGDKVAEGTVWSLVKNAIDGVAGDFSKILEMEGVGYRAAMEGGDLVLFLGYAEPVHVKLPSGVAVKVDKNTITVSGVDKELVGRVAANIRALKKPEPYKGKGIHYRGEVIRRKVGKKAATTGAA
ncbi:MAG: 50S ribosomal protein L6 [Patescibacteria group bacterium]|nr:50S ribosomal protein L6 [Patescibacteria group bacterium]MDE2015569.1 50S ribosomal protein L6 [Patescibacteria group bacterium]MDE2227235.1 50S ribosomal protein L6 [Patescibacteria group bacterium]